MTQLTGGSALRNALAYLLYEENRLKAAAAARDEAQRHYWHAQTKRNAAMTRAAELLRAERGAVTYDGHRFERLGMYNVRVTAADTELRIEQTTLPLQARA